jgi:hypothetical protein
MSDIYGRKPILYTRVAIFIVSSQGIVGRDRRGIATASNLFSRSVGSAVGIALIGTLANASLCSWIGHPPSSLIGHLPTSVNGAVSLLENKVKMAAPTKTFIRRGLFHATHTAFLAVVGSAFLTMLALLAMPKRSIPLIVDEDQTAQD